MKMYKASVRVDGEDGSITTVFRVPSTHGMAYDECLRRLYAFVGQLVDLESIPDIPDVIIIKMPQEVEDMTSLQPSEDRH